MGVDVDRIDTLERRDTGGAEVIGNQRAVDPFVDVGVGADGDDEPVSQRPGKFKVLDVAGVDDVKTAVAMNDGLAIGSGILTEFEQLGEG